MVEKKDPSNKEEGQLSELLQQMATTERGGASTGIPAGSKFDARPSSATPPRGTTVFGKPPGGQGEFAPRQPAVANSSTFQTGQQSALRESQSRAALGSSSEAASKQPTVQYLDDHSVREIFVDGLNTVHFDGHTLRIEFGVTRAKRSEAAASQVLERLPACRLVLSPQAIAELKSLMEKISSAAPQNPAAVAGREKK